MIAWGLLFFGLYFGWFQGRLASMGSLFRDASGSDCSDGYMVGFAMGVITCKLMYVAAFSLSLGLYFFVFTSRRDSLLLQYAERLGEIEPLGLHQSAIRNSQSEIENDQAH